MHSETKTTQNLYLDIEQRLRQRPDIDLGASVYRNHQLNDIKQLVEDMLGGAEESTKARIRSEFFSSGPIESLLGDDSITEVIINGSQKICYESAGQLHQLTDCFYSDLSFRNFIHRICQEAHIQTNLNTPCGDGAWRGYRVHLIQAPLVEAPFHLCLRRHPQSVWTLEKLISQGWCESDQLDFIKDLINQRKNLLIVGSTSSGKTSLLNACLDRLPSHERVVSIEDANEIVSPNFSSVKLLTRTDSNRQLQAYDQSDLIKQSLRMRPDRLVMGEVRGGEAKDLLMALSSGHRGSMGTLHADSAKQALWRLEMLVQMGAPHWSLQAIRRLIQLSLDALIVVQKDQGQRRLEGVYRIASLEDVGFLVEKVC